uniref:Uncharacterized protein n=1 Tax=Oryza punctata TaxID=4537 RepID=A0A0E0KD89_ORYPU
MWYRKDQHERRGDSARDSPMHRIAGETVTDLNSGGLIPLQGTEPAERYWTPNESTIMGGTRSFNPER